MQTRKQTYEALIAKLEAVSRSLNGLYITDMAIDAENVPEFTWDAYADSALWLSMIYAAESAAAERLIAAGYRPEDYGIDY